MTDIPKLPIMNDDDLTQLIAALESLPEELKNADPLTTPNYEQRLAQALKDANKD